MAQVFNLPTIGDAMTEGEIVEWLVSIGDDVAVDQPICSIETDKSVVELTSPFRGTVLSLGGSVGQTLAVGSPLIVVGRPNDVGSRQPQPAPVVGDTETESRMDGVATSPNVLSPLIRRLADEHGVDLSTVIGTGVGGRITREDVVAATGPKLSVVVATESPRPLLAMPRVRRAARERNIDLASMDTAGTGPRGSVTMDDLDRLGDQDSSPTVVPLAPTQRTVAEPRRERLSAMRRSIAAHLTESAQTIPQFTSTVEVDATALLATRAALTKSRQHPVPLDALLIRLLLPVLQAHPTINAMLDSGDTGDEIVYFNHFDIGVAVDTPDGLMVPVVRQADQRDLDDLCHEILRLANAARDRSIQPADFGGQTFTVNNVGALGIVSGTPILPLQTSTIAAFGVARSMVQLREGQAVEVPMMTISATFDHRLIDGGDSARFLTQLKSHLETPALGLL